MKAFKITVLSVFLVLLSSSIVGCEQADADTPTATPAEKTAADPVAVTANELGAELEGQAILSEFDGDVRVVRSQDSTVIILRDRSQADRDDGVVFGHSLEFSDQVDRAVAKLEKSLGRKPTQVEINKMLGRK